MSFPRTTFVLALSLLTVSSAAAFDFEVEEPKMFEIHGQLAELILWRNDSDFDATAPTMTRKANLSDPQSRFYGRW